MRIALAPFLSPEGYVAPRSWALAKELHLAPELGHALVRRACPRRTDAGGGEPVMLLPGFLAGDYSLQVLGAALRRHGYRTYRSTIRTNISCLNETALKLEARLEEVVDRRGERARLVGHSLGGMLARGLAVRRPDLVSGVVTMGSPLMAPGTAHPLLMTAASLLARASRAGVPGVMAEDCLAGECARTTWAEFHEPLAPEVELTCLYSKWDGLVDWRSCIHPEARPVEIRASHVGMAISPAVHDRVLAELQRQRRQAQRSKSICA